MSTILAPKVSQKLHFSIYIFSTQIASQCALQAPAHNLSLIPCSSSFSNLLSVNYANNVNLYYQLCLLV